MKPASLVLAAALAALCAPVSAADPQALDQQRIRALLGEPNPDHTPDLLPPLQGVVSWKLLEQVEPVRLKDRVVPRFAPDVAALDATEVRLQGFMMPLDMGEQQKHFVLMAVSPSCAYCMTGGAERLVEVRAKAPVKFTVNPVIVTGRLALLKDDPAGLYYRLTEAVAVK
jgi:hypothetical protein